MSTATQQPVLKPWDTAQWDEFSKKFPPHVRPFCELIRLHLADLAEASRQQTEYVQGLHAQQTKLIEELQAEVFSHQETIKELKAKLETAHAPQA